MNELDLELDEFNNGEESNTPEPELEMEFEQEEKKEQLVNGKDKVQLEYEANLKLFNKLISIVPVGQHPPQENACNTCSAALWKVKPNQFYVYCTREHDTHFSSLDLDKDIVYGCIGNPHHTEVMIQKQEEKLKEEIKQNALDLSNKNKEGN